MYYFSLHFLIIVSYTCTFYLFSRTLKSTFEYNKYNYVLLLTLLYHDRNEMLSSDKMLSALGRLWSMVVLRFVLIILENMSLAIDYICISVSHI